LSQLLEPAQFATLAQHATLNESDDTVRTEWAGI
jgi:hypothetical protein